MHASDATHRWPARGVCCSSLEAKGVLRLRFTKMTLHCRLRRAIGQKVALEAPGFSSEVGRLQKVYPRFIKVTGQYFVPHNLDRIVLSRACRRLPKCRVMIRTTFDETIRARLVQIGLDFIEVVELHTLCRRRVLLPWGRVVGIEYS